MVKLSREAVKQAGLPKVHWLKSLAPIKLAALIGAAVMALLIIAAVMAVVVFPPGISINPGDKATEIKPADQGLDIGTSSWGASITSVTVTQQDVAPDGALGASRLVNGQLKAGHFVTSDGANPLKPDEQYTVTVDGTVKKLGITGISSRQVEQTSTFRTVTTPMPVIPQGGLVVKFGEDLKLQWNVPVSSFKYQLDGIQSTSTLSGDGKTATIKLASFEQGKKYQFTVTSATSKNGVDMNQPIAATVSTPAGLSVAFDPADNSSRASTDVYPTVNFSEAVANPDAAQQLVSVDPKVGGSFHWASPNKLQFVPAKEWDHLQDVTIRVKGGVQGFRGVSGGYIDSDQQATFTTAPAKSIDVNVTTERVTLLENGNPIDSFLCASGANNTPTPLGDFTIYAKLPAVDMRGPGYFAPHVPWVMVFDGDYTLHGNYWNTTFGVRGSGGSHGCVGMPPATAKRVYDWAPLGTPVHIHE